MKFVTDYKELEDGDKARSLLNHCKPEPIENKKAVLDYMSDQKYFEAIRASHIYDYVENVRTVITNKTYTDGEFFLSVEEKYHFENYNLKLEQDFIKKIEAISEAGNAG